MIYRYPVAQPEHDGNEAKYLSEAIKSGWTSSAGPFVERFEAEFASWVGAKYAVATNTGTAALKIALLAAGIKPGDEVLIPEFTMIATARAVTNAGAIPVFVDCGEDLNIDVNKIEAAITPRTKAIIPVHVYGRPCDMAQILPIAEDHNLIVIEDAAEAHGAHIEGQKVGTWGEIGCFSLYANKIITAGEGGICVTDDKHLYEAMKKERSFYFTPDHSFLHEKEGDNYRMTNLQAAVACAQLERVDEFLEKREQIRRWYDNLIGEFSLPRPEGSVLWMYDIVVDEEDRNELMNVLAKLGVETRYFFKPMSMQPPYKAFAKPYEKTNAYAYSKAGLYLPSYTQLTQYEVDDICQKIKTFFR